MRAWAGPEISDRLLYAADKAACEATPGTYTCDPAMTAAGGGVYLDSTSTTLYVHLADGSDPRTNAVLVEYTGKRDYAINYNNTSCVNWMIRGIWCYRNYNNNGGMHAQRGRKVYDCRFSDGTKHNVLFARNTLCEDSLCDEAYYGTTNAGMFNYYDDAHATEGVTFNRCQATLTTFDDNSVIGGFGGHSSIGNTKLAFARFTDCVVRNCYSAYACGGVSETTITNCAAYGCPEVAQQNDYDNVTSILGGTFEIYNGAAAGNRQICPQAGTESNSRTLILRDATFEFKDTSQVALQLGRDYEVAATIQRCAIRPISPAAHDAITHVMSSNNAATTIASDHNTLEGQGYIVSLYAEGTTVDADYNTLVGPLNATAAFCFDGNDKSLAQWQALGHDTHSTVV
jgi:hypothetical protein